MDPDELFEESLDETGDDLFEDTSAELQEDLFADFFEGLS